MDDRFGSLVYAKATVYLNRVRVRPFDFSGSLSYLICGISGKVVSCQGSQEIHMYGYRDWIYRMPYVMRNGTEETFIGHKREKF